MDFGGLPTLSTLAANPAELQVVQGNNQFTSDLYKTVANQQKNIIFSPIGIHAILSMVFQGARGTTAEHLAATLKIPEASAAAEGYNAIINRLNDIENVTLHMANKIFLNKSDVLLTDFENAVAQNFLSEVELVNFVETEAAAKTINDWVAEKTCGKIKNLIATELLNDATRLVLVNAIYFKGNWKHRFDARATKIERFYLNDVDCINVHMMHIKKKFYYKEDRNLNAQILELPYINENISMVIILPRRRNGIGDLEKKLATTNFSEITQGMWSHEVIVSLPRFKIEQTIDLRTSLTTLGLGEIFVKDKANFRGMIPMFSEDNLYVSNAIHKAFIEVNEEGAEAAAATGMVMGLFFGSSSATPIPIRFVADHPFTFLLVERFSYARKNILFAGKVGKP